MNNKLDYIAIDFEIANQYRNSACSVGLVRFIDEKETDSCYSLIHPAKMYFIPEWTRNIHHISYNDVRNKPYFPEIWDTMVMPFINQTPGVPLEDSRTCGQLIKLTAEKWGVNSVEELLKACGSQIRTFKFFQKNILQCLLLALLYFIIRAIK